MKPPLLVGDPDNQKNASITNPQHMRQFSGVIASGKSAILLRFIEGEITIELAAKFSSSETITISIHDSLIAFLESLSKLPAEQVVELSDDELILFDQVMQKIEFIKKLNAAYKVAQ